MKGRILHLVLLAFLAFNYGCAGYHFNTNSNPLIGYDIKSIAVPMFINRTNIPALNTYTTKEIILTLNDYNGLKVYGGDRLDADAVLVGILESSDLYNTTFKSSENVFTDGGIKNSIGNRAPFYYSTKTTYNYQLRIYIIKRPSANEIELLMSGLGPQVKLNPKIVLIEVLPITGSFTRAVSENTGATTGGAVNFTKNKGLLIKSLKDTSVQVANSFKQVILNAF